VVTIQELSY